MARVSKEKAVKRLRKLLADVSEVYLEGEHSQKYAKWILDVDRAFYRIFGEGSREYEQIPDTYRGEPQDYLDFLVSLVESNLDDIEHFWEDDGVSIKSETQPFLHDTVRADKRVNTNKVFIIHGRDESARETVARFLQDLSLEAVILHEKPNKGRTIIEKFEDYADVEFAVVLLTPDDVGALREKKPELHPRARQNVILELGFFIGRLGRERVCVLKKDVVEAPSDYEGVAYTDLDDGGGWKIELVRELKSAGFGIDTSRMFRS